MRLFHVRPGNVRHCHVEAVDLGAVDIFSSRSVWVWRSHNCYRPTSADLRAHERRDREFQATDIR
jgi:hypothetical protein